MKDLNIKKKFPVIEEIGNLIERARRAALEGKKSELLDILDELSNAQNVLLEKVGNTVDLGFSKMVEDGATLNETEYNLKKLINEALQLRKNQFKENGNIISLTLEEGMPQYFFGDFDRIEELVNKIVKVANHYSRDGEITISARSEKTEYSDMVTIEIHNTNTQALENEMERLNYYMGHNNVHLDGFVLEEDVFVVKVLVRQLAGKIKFVRAEKNGVKVIVTIPQLAVENK